MWPGQDLHNTHTAIADGVATYQQRPGYPIHVVNERSNEDHSSFHAASGLRQQPALARSIYEDADRLIPSVESDTHVLSRQHRDEPNLSNRQFQDHFIGPRIVELKDDPIPHVVKRRRIADRETSAAKVLYQPVDDRHYPGAESMLFRPSHNDNRLDPKVGAHGTAVSESLRYAQGPPRYVELVPISGGVEHRSMDGLANGSIQHRMDGIAQEKHALPSSPNALPKVQSYVHSPLLQTQPRFSASLPSGQRPELMPSGLQPAFGRHDPPQPLRTKDPDMSTSYIMENPPSTGSPRFSHPMYHKEQGTPVRSRPLHPNNEIFEHADRRHALNQSYEARNGMRSLGGGLQGSEYPPVAPSQVYHNIVVQDSQSLGRPRRYNLPGQRLYYRTEEEHAQPPSTQK